MSKKNDRTTKVAKSFPSPVPASPAALPFSFLSTAFPTALGEGMTPQYGVPLKFAEGSSFQNLPVEEQRRLIGYLHVYLKELPRLLEEGEAGRFAVIKDHEVVHVWDTADDAMQAATLLIGPGQFAVYQVKDKDVDRLACSENAKEA